MKTTTLSYNKINRIDGFSFVCFVQARVTLRSTAMQCFVFNETTTITVSKVNIYGN